MSPANLFGGKVIIPKKILADPKRLVRVVENTLSARATDVKVDFKVTTRTWDHQPIFTIATKPMERIIYTSDLVYMFMDLGTKPHVIRPRRAKALHFFATGFAPKSKPRVIASGTGRMADADETYRMLVHHPGTEARDFCEVIAEKWRKELPVIMQRAIDAEAILP